MRLYSLLLRLYPSDVRYAYGREMRDAFAVTIARARRRGAIPCASTAARELIALAIDVVAQRASTIYSHRSFHSRRPPDLSMVRPPNMSKDEWFGWDRSQPPR